MTDEQLKQKAWEYFETINEIRIDQDGGENSIVDAYIEGARTQKVHNEKKWYFVKGTYIVFCDRTTPYANGVIQDMYNTTPDTLLSTVRKKIRESNYDEMRRHPNSSIKINIENIIVL